MIVYDLSCDSGHRFEGWFGSSADFTDQQENGLLYCPQCGSVHVTKAPMAPAVPKKGNQAASLAPVESEASAPAPAPAASDGKSSDQPQPMAGGQPSPEALRALTKLAEMQAKALEKSTYVGDKFADKSRAMHYGEEDQGAIHGEATLKDAEELLEEGIAVAPLPFPVAKPEDVN